MALTGKHLIAGHWTRSSGEDFYGFDPINNRALRVGFASATRAEVDQAIGSADQAFYTYSETSASQRAIFLRTIGEQIINLGDELIDTACLETGLPPARLISERARTVAQLQLFADLLAKGAYQARIDLADDQRQPLAKPDTRLGYIAIGVVAVFAASNFPLAFSTAGGDTASALAAGCPVVFKGHSAHPGTAELVAQAILSAMQICRIASGTFSLLQGEDHGIASQMVLHPKVKAVGFTGSERVGMILQQQIYQRAEPIPFYGELGSVNPQFILANKLAADGIKLAQTLVNSLTLGQGQFCTSPGLWIVVGDTQQRQAFEQAAAIAVGQTTAGVMLTTTIASAYKNTVQQWQDIANVQCLAQGQPSAPHYCRAALFATDLATFKQNQTLQQEVFGACALIIRCKNIDELFACHELLRGNLTASIHGVAEDLQDSKKLSKKLIHKVGRLIYNQMPTGVEVCSSMNHGGPFPASTDLRTTSVGSMAMSRFQRPICYQNMPKQLLPALLK